MSLGDASTREGLSLSETLCDGLIVYVSSYPLQGASAFAFRIGSRELILGASRRITTLAHEIGHSFCLRDIYRDSRHSPYYSSGSPLVVDEPASRDYFSEVHDWNSGSAQRYYPFGTPQADLLDRLLMCGSGRRNVRGDIPLSYVYGVKRERGFRAVLTEVGLESVVIDDNIVVH